MQTCKHTIANFIVYILEWVAIYLWFFIFAKLFSRIVFKEVLQKRAYNLRLLPLKGGGAVCPICHYVFFNKRINHPESFLDYQNMFPKNVQFEPIMKKENNDIFHWDQVYNPFSWFINIKLNDSLNVTGPGTFLPLRSNKTFFLLKIQILKER